MDALECVLAARSLLADATPLRGDCGRACGAACCRPDADGQGGMLLFPGEEALYTLLPPGCTLSRDDAVMPGMTLFTCAGVCARGERPLACRFFPLIPVIEARGERTALRLMPDPRAWPVCPLMAGGLRAMDPRFRDAAAQAARVLCKSDAIRDYLRALQGFFTRLRAF